MSRRSKTLGVQKAKRRKRTSKAKEFDINKLVNIASKTGKIIIGSKSVKKYLHTNDLKMIIFANNCPQSILDEFNNLLKNRKDEILIYQYPFSSWELGAAAAKPFMIATMGIVEAGDSNIIEEVKSRM
ncbi:MAG: 50S ribosomal protein L30e [Promethearchaeota archaeon]